LTLKNISFQLNFTYSSVFQTQDVKDFVVGDLVNVLAPLEREDNFVKKVNPSNILKISNLKDLVFCTKNSPCQNGGICQNNAEGNYTCKCIPGFGGRNCERKLTKCEEEPCYNGAKCIPVSSEAIIFYLFSFSVVFLSWISLFMFFYTWSFWPFL